MVVVKSIIYLSVYMHAQIRNTPNQDRGEIKVCLPKKLIPRWCSYIGGGDHPKTTYRYFVAEAVRQAGSTREAFLACWHRYRSAAQSKGEKHFHEDVFQRFCAAGFGRATDDAGERRLEFVRRILTEHGEPEPVRSMLVRHAYIYVIICSCMVV